MGKDRGALQSAQSTVNTYDVLSKHNQNNTRYVESKMKTRSSDIETQGPIT